MEKLKIKQGKHGDSGFTIIEVLVALFVIALTLVGILTLAANNITTQYINKENVIASMISQEGLELVRKKRDENWLSGADWKTGIVGDGTYSIDYLGNTADIDGGIDDSLTRLKLNNGFYQHALGENTSFSRLISVIDNGDYLEVTSTVRFKSQSNSFDYAAATYLYDWGYQ